jgi:uncharacterized protein (DUF1499 family)
MLLSTLKWFAIFVSAMAVLGIGAGRLGWLQGHAPTDLGVRDGRLKAPSDKPNSVSSQAHLHPDHPRLAYATIEPLSVGSDSAVAMARIAATVSGMRGAQVVKHEPGYVYATFETKVMRYVDDVEFWFDPASGLVQVRSASRLGYSDRGVNRVRIEAIRAALAAGAGKG